MFGQKSAGRSIPVACLDAMPRRPVPLMPAVDVAPVNRSTALDGLPWLWNPISLSSRFLDAWTSRLSADAAGDSCEWPRGLDVVDSGSGPPTDLEGTPRNARWIIRDGRRCSVLATIVSASTPSDLSGHGGLTGWDFESLKVYSNAPSDPPATAAHIVVNARCLPFASGLYALTCLGGEVGADRAPSIVIAKIRHGDTLMQHGRWVPPTSFGNGAWESPWLELAEPSAVLHIVNVEEKK